MSDWSTVSVGARFMEGDAPGGRTERTMVVVAMSKEVPGCSCEAVEDGEAAVGGPGREAASLGDLG